MDIFYKYKTIKEIQKSAQFRLQHLKKKNINISIKILADSHEIQIQKN